MYESESPASTGSPVLVEAGLPPARGPESALDALLFGLLRSAVLAVWADPGWMGAAFRADVVPLLSLPAGPRLLAALAGVPAGPCPADHGGPGQSWQEPCAGMPPLGTPGNPCPCMLALAAAWQACTGYAAAGAHAAVAAAAGGDTLVLPRDGARPAIADPAREEIAAALRVSPQAAGTRIGHARRLARMPALAGLLAQGVLPPGSPERIAAGLAGLDDADAEHCDATLGRRVGDRLQRGRRPWTGTDAAAAARRIAVRCPSAAGARRRATGQRHVRRWSNGDGTATFSAILPEVAAERMYRRLTSMAAALPSDDPRPMDARRADLLADLVLGAGQSRASGVEVQVVIDAAALLGTGRPGTACDLADVPGLGPIPAEVARELAADAAWRAWIRDAAGTITATGSTTYTPGAALSRLVRARHPHCRAPGCRRPAAACDLDHAVPWPQGPTSPDNLGPLCRRHHNLKTHLRWQLDTDRDTITWTTPAGTTIQDQAETVLLL